MKIPYPEAAPDDYSVKAQYMKLSPEWFGLVQALIPRLEVRALWENMTDSEYETLIDWIRSIMTPAEVIVSTGEAVKVRSSVNISVSAGVWSSVSWDIEEFDDLAMHDSANPSRLTAINAGDYEAVLQLGIQGGSGYFSIRILLNNVTEIAHIIEQSATHDRSSVAIARVRMSAGDYVVAQFNSGVGSIVLPSSYLFFALTRLK